MDHNFLSRKTDFEKAFQLVIYTLQKAFGNLIIVFLKIIQNYKFKASKYLQMTIATLKHSSNDGDKIK